MKKNNSVSFKLYKSEIAYKINFDIGEYNPDVFSVHKLQVISGQQCHARWCETQQIGNPVI